MCPFTVFEKAGAKKVAIKCQTEKVCWFCYFFQKERHGFDRWTSIYLSIHPSLYLFIIERTLEEADKSEETVKRQLWKELSTAHHGAGKPSILQFYHGMKMYITWCLRGARPLILAWGKQNKQLLLSISIKFIMESLCNTDRNCFISL